MAIWQWKNAKLIPLKQPTFFLRLNPIPVPAGIQFRLEPAEICLAELLPQTGDVEADRHPVHVARAGAGHRVDVSVGVHPEDHRVLTVVQTARQTAQTHTVISAQSERQPALLQDPHHLPTSLYSTVRGNAQ